LKIHAQLRKCVFVCIVAILVVSGPLMVEQAWANYSVSVGYADNLRPTPFFPLPWSGSSNVALFAGNPGGAVPPVGTYDSGAIMIANTGASAIQINNFSVTVPTWNGDGIGTNTANLSNEWAAFASSFSGAGLTVNPGQVVIFTQDGNINGNNSFDTSDNGLAASQFLNGNPTPTNNCGVGTNMASPACAAAMPTVTADVNGVSTTFDDTAFVLNSGAFDAVNYNPCFNPADTPGNCNESQQWRLIGTVGTACPGGVCPTPEPGSLALMSTLLPGFAGITWIRRRRKIDRIVTSTPDRTAPPSTT